LHLRVELTPADQEGPEARQWEFALRRAVTLPDYWASDEMERGDDPLLVDAKSRTISLLVPRAGRWRVRWSVMHYEAVARDGGVSIRGSGSGPAGDGRFIEFEESDTPGEVDLPIEPKELAKFEAAAR
jgi:hypothetical protein